MERRPWTLSACDENHAFGCGAEWMLALVTHTDLSREARRRRGRGGEGESFSASRVTSGAELGIAGWEDAPIMTHRLIFSPEPGRLGATILDLGAKSLKSGANSPALGATTLESGANTLALGANSAALGGVTQSDTDLRPNYTLNWTPAPGTAAMIKVRLM